MGQLLIHSFTGALQECSRHTGPLWRPMISSLPLNSCQTSGQEKSRQIPSSSPHINVRTCFLQTHFSIFWAPRVLHSPLEVEDTIREPLKPSLSVVFLSQPSAAFPPCLWFRESHPWGQCPLICSKTSMPFSPGPISPSSWMTLVDIKKKKLDIFHLWEDSSGILQVCCPLSLYTKLLPFCLQFLSRYILSTSMKELSSLL